MATMNRRDFLRNVGIASAAGAAACTYDPKVPSEHIYPYVVQPDEELPGTANYFSTVCTSCSTACGLVARSKEGRVVMVEGNPDHPTGPGLCARGHFDMVATYSPDRLKTPFAGGNETTWDDATAQLVGAIKAAREGGKTVAWLGQYRSGSTARLLDELTGAIGLRRVHWEALGVESLLTASRQVFGMDALPSFDLSGAHVIVSFGMDFLGTAFDSMFMAKGWAAAKDPAKGNFVTRFVAIEPRVGVTSSQADHFLAPNPGTETQVAFALARLVADAKGYEGPAKALLAAVDVGAAATASGLSREKLAEIAGWIQAGPSVVLPGGPANAGTDATALAIAALLINEVAGNVGRSVVFGRESKPGQVNSYADVKALLDDATAGRIGVLILDGVNPVYSLPGGAAVGAALDAADVLVQLANERDDSTRSKTLLLPTGTGLEGWGDAQVTSGIHALQQPAMTPLHPVKGVGDLLLALGQALAPTGATPATATPAAATPATATPATEGAPAAGATPVEGAPPANPAHLGFNYPIFRDYVKERWRREVYPAGSTESFDAFWTAALQRGGYFPDTPRTGASVRLAALPEAAAPIGGSGLALVVFPSPILGDGRHANVPWAQELPDPITTGLWTSWAELNPKFVATLGLGPNDRVKVKTAGGEIVVPYFASPGVREDTVAVMLGNGHTGMGRYASGRGANPIPLVTATADTVSGALATYTLRATVERADDKGDLVPAIGNVDQAGRQLANLATVDESLANLGKGAGKSVHLHTLPVDPRLVEAGMLDMYPEPQHPTYRFAMAIDTNTCNGCMACVVACALENNTPFVGPDQTRRGRTMRWIRMNRYWEGEGEHQDVRYLPSLCQHCAHAPCEGVCPVLATYHNLDGLNAMIYNRCVGTRYCANNCPYTARRFNFHTWQWPEEMHLMLNPDVSAREMGVMEKCTFCVQRLRAVKDSWRDVHETVPASALTKLTACAAACPTDSITFGNAKDTEGPLAEKFADSRAYTLLGELNTKPGVRYLARVSHHAKAPVAHGGAGAHGDAGGHQEGGSGSDAGHGGGSGHDENPAGHGEKPADHGTAH